MKCKLCKWLEFNYNCFRCSKHELIHPCDDFELDKNIAKEIHQTNIEIYNKNKEKSELGGFKK